jgi:hypothetical protein
VTRSATIAACLSLFCGAAAFILGAKFFA